MRNVNLLIKPASSLCNLRCRYCFYADIADVRDVDSYGIMPIETAATLIDRTFEAVDPNGAVSFMFQGGEPTMAGLAYFEQFVSYVASKRPPNVQVQYAIQTNGMLINDSWAELFLQHNFLVGISVDGYRDLHDFNRLTPAHQGSYTQVTKAVQLLLNKRVEVNLLCVVTGQCARHPQKVYAELKKLKTPYLQFIPCLDPLEEERGSAPYSLTPEVYGKFLCGLFDEWYRDWEAGRYTSIRLFNDYVYLAMGLPASSCAASGGCGSYFVVEGDGSIYPCDFYVLDEWRMGNVLEQGLEEMAKGATASRFLQEGAQRPNECARCQWLRLCNGGCRRDWQQTEDGTHNYYCTAFQKLFAHAAPRILHIARREMQMRRMSR